MTIRLNTMMDELLTDISPVELGNIIDEMSHQYASICLKHPEDQPQQPAEHLYWLKKLRDVLWSETQIRA